MPRFHKWTGGMRTVSQFGVDRRRSRIEGRDGRTLLLAIDHGLPAGPIPGIERPAELLRRMRSVPFSSLVVNAGRVTDAAQSFGVPVLIMAYAPAESGRSSDDAFAAAHAARAAAEIGASIIQTNFAGSADGVRTIIRGCPVPVVMAGGPRTVS